MIIDTDSPEARQCLITRLKPDGDIETVGCVIYYNDETKVMRRQQVVGDKLETYEETTDNCRVFISKSPYGPGILDYEDARWLHYVKVLEEKQSA